MSKWLIWTLLELTTLLFVASLVFIWLSHSLKKKAKDASVTKTDSIELTKEEQDIKSYKRLANFLDKQISFAVSAIRPELENQHETNTIKLWGTILRAERAIILNQASTEPTPILTRFLSSLLYALSAPKLQMANADELNQSLKKMETELFQTAELLIVKESLTKNQILLNEDLRDSIDKANRHLAQLRIKQKEQQRLELEVNELKSRINNLEKSQTENSNSFVPFKMTLPDNQKLSLELRNTSFKQISSLHHLSDRQEMVIDQLKNEIEKNSNHKNPHNSIEAQKIAIAKMERMAEETQTLIIQLETELETSNLSITSLKQDISLKDSKLAEMEKQLSESNETAIGNLHTLNVNKKETLSSLRDGLSSALESRSSESLIEQEKDTKMLERLLQESETCVALLAQELDTIEKVNQELKQKVETSITHKDGKNSHYSKSLQVQRERNRELVQITTKLKTKMLDMASGKDYQELRVAYNKKSLEYDRLQLASSDLEMKYLGMLK